MMPAATYTQGDELGDLGIDWRDRTGTLIDFSTGYTFEVKVAAVGSAALFTKTTGGSHGGATGAATSPNVTIPWATTGELNAVTTPGVYVLQIRATRTADGKVRTQQGDIQINAAVT